MQGVPASRQPVWPELKRSCLPAQVLDDSTCKVTRQLVDEKAAEWAERGIKCEVVRRTNRQGYKAGALKDVSPLTACLPASAVCSASRHMPGWPAHVMGVSGTQCGVSWACKRDSADGNWVSYRGI